MRDFLREALEIYAGESKRPVEREHLEAVVNRMAELERRDQQVRQAIALEFDAAFERQHGRRRAS